MLTFNLVLLFASKSLNFLSVVYSFTHWNNNIYVIFNNSVYN